ncbi:MAG: NYN domain-containing protein [Rhodobacteraceae bacterium CG17_big_fil_post_rev_8_21_14_2_50_63_15]|nr:NYN domain-containing protein [Roseovarius sp.]PIV77998.1 MAG: NYN domain-containing protein [Rhodobacteraceae bacterium CG17_big_fil_post_rev_8_21_14_2_50_63_15]
MSILPPFRTTDLPRLSVFVDADNISAAQATAILDLARRLGAPDLIRAYGNACHRPEWDRVPGFHLIHSGSGKNATDMLICLDAMERALSQQCEAVLLVSSDQDFTHLATRLRERGLTVIGAGEAKTSERFRAACSVFEELAAPVSPRSTPPPDDLDSKIHEIIKPDNSNRQSIPVTQLSNSMWAKHKFKISEHPDKNWTDYLGHRTHLYEVAVTKGTTTVRCKPAAFKIAAN